MIDDKYIQKRVNPIIEDVKAVWKLDDSDEWLKSFKETIGHAINRAYEDGFADGENEGEKEVEPDTSLKEGLMESRG